MYRITPLLVGLRSADQGMMTYQSDYGKKIWLPMWAFLLQGDDKTVIIDTGLDDFMAPPAFTEETGLEPQFMDEALESVGISPGEIDVVINTHLHDDHCGNNPLFENARFYIQAAEIDFCKNPHPVDDRYDESFIEGLDIHALEGDFSPLPGIEIIFTPGHTPGAQTIRAQTDKGSVIIPGFCCNEKNFPAGGAVVCPGVHGDAYQAYDNARTVRNMEGIILPTHSVLVPELLKR